MANVFVAKECASGETRVAATPETVKKLVKDGLSVTVEAGLGLGAHIADQEYEAAGATITSDAKAAWQQADLVLKVSPPTQNDTLGADECALLKAGAILVSHIWTTKNLPLVKSLMERQVSCLAMELIPRISRAQVMDSLSSQANIAGYKAVLLAAATLDKYFPLLMTAAGTVQPARVVIMGAGVAGLQAIATARRLGAVVEVSDIRPAVKEQVESLGGKFIDLPELEGGEDSGGYAKEVTKEFLEKQQAIVRERVILADVVITTAQVPGRRAPLLVKEEVVKEMRDGAVIVDLAADSGGNCECTEAGQVVVKHGVHILGYSDLPNSMPLDASALYARNIYALIKLLNNKGELSLDLEDEIIKGALLTHNGELRHAPTKDLLAGGA